MQQRMFWALLVVALAAGFAITWVDSLPTWDDAGVTAAAIFGVTLLLSAARPSRAWLWALLVGGGIPLLGILQHNYAMIVVLIIAGIGSAVGAIGRKTLDMASKEITRS
jgi:hypothetical protein